MRFLAQRPDEIDSILSEKPAARRDWAAGLSCRNAPAPRLGCKAGCDRGNADWTSDPAHRRRRANVARRKNSKAIFSIVIAGIRESKELARQSPSKAANIGRGFHRQKV